MPAERASMDDQLILDRYRLLERLAAGGSAEVWRARDEQLDRDVAVKRLHAHLFADDASRARLAAEARAAARLSHPVIVGVYDVDATGDAPALVMELVDGESLAARLDRDGPLPDREAAEIVADLAEALFHAHQQGVIHRDIKPGNVLLDRNGRTRLVDFGIARSLAEASARLTVTGTVIGTLRAMAPEQLEDGQITPRTDLYGLGVVLHEALTARPPYPSGSPLALAEAQRAGPPPLDGLDPGLAAVIAACLALDPADRPLHAGAVAEALRSWLAGDSSPALALAPTPTVPVDTAAVTQPVPVVAPPPAPAAPPPASARRPLRIAPILAGLAAVAAVAVLVAFAANRPDPAADAAPSASASADATPVPTPTPPPEWLAELVEKVAKDCEAEVALDAEAEMAAMTEDEAEEYADALVEECKDEGGDDEDGDGGGGGRGGGNGGGNGRGNDD